VLQVVEADGAIPVRLRFAKKPAPPSASSAATAPAPSAAAPQSNPSLELPVELATVAGTSVEGPVIEVADA
jgi:hypothetical protein